MATVKYAFRKEFKPFCKETLQWYPGHMDKSFNAMQSKIKQVDCVIEVHDARIPFSGRNPNFINRLIGPKPHILVLNKKDLISTKTILDISKKINSEVVFTNSKLQKCRGLRQVVPKTIDLVYGSDRFNRAEERNLRLMVIGVPNVGKSSLINGLRNLNLHRGKATAVGAKAGITKSVQTDIKVNINPPVYLVDTPGILPPKVNDSITGLKLALCSCLNDDVVGYLQMADFLLFWCNKHQYFDYVDYFKLDGPCDDVTAVLTRIAKQENLFKKRKNLATNEDVLHPDVEAAGARIVRAYRSGFLGTFSWDLTELD